MLSISKFMFDLNLKNPNVELINHNSTKPNHCQNRNFIHCNVIINNVLQNLLKHESNTEINSDLRLLPI